MHERKGRSKSEETINFSDTTNSLSAAAVAVPVQGQAAAQVPGWKCSLLIGSGGALENRQRVTLEGLRTVTTVSGTIK